MKLIIKLSDKAWGIWFLYSTIVLALVILIVTTWKSLDTIDIIALLSIAFINFIASVLVGMHKQDILN